MTAKPLNPNLENIRRILVLQLRQIGDVLLSTPSLELLHRRFPEAQIDVLTEIKCAPMLENNPHIHAIRRLDKSRMPTLLHEIPWYWKMARDKYDLLVDFQQLPRCRWIAAFSDAPVRLTYTPSWWKRPLYTHHVDNLPGYAASSKASILRPLGIEWNGELPRLYLYPEELDEAAFHLKTAGLATGGGVRLIALDVTHKDPARRWPARHYAELLAALVKKEPDLRFLLLYGPGEKPQTEEVLALYNGPDVFIHIPPTPSVRAAAAYIAHSSLLLGNCSAPRHMAVALDVPSYIISLTGKTAWLCPTPMHAQFDPPPDESVFTASEPTRSRMIKIVRNGVLEHLTRFDRKC